MKRKAGQVLSSLPPLQVVSISVKRKRQLYMGKKHIEQRAALIRLPSHILFALHSSGEKKTCGGSIALVSCKGGR